MSSRISTATCTDESYLTALAVSLTVLAVVPSRTCTHAVDLRRCPQMLTRMSSAATGTANSASRRSNASR